MAYSTKISSGVEMLALELDDVKSNYHTFKLDALSRKDGTAYVEMKVSECATVDTMIMNFEQYLRACGYLFNGELTLTGEQDDE
jgi:hypothetical protein|tara:strand:- start:1305 stop:1556 length:252 start_codon:yes stop_codon:yes gene_type:complete